MHCGLSFEELAPRNFSFNSPYGACETCDGLGTKFQVDPELLVPDDDLSIDEGAIAPWSGFRGEYFKRVLAAVGDEYGFSTDTPWKKLKAAQKKVVLYGAGGKQVTVRYKNRYGRQRSYATKLRRRGAVGRAPAHREPTPIASASVIEGYMRLVPCPACGGARLRPASLAVTIGGQNIFEVGELSISDAVAFFKTVELSRARSAHRRARVQGSARAAAVHARRRPRLPVAQPRVGHARRRRGAAHPARVADRQRARRRAVRARRAVDRAAPARQPAADRDARAAAQPRQHGDRRRARRGDDPRRRPRRRHRAGRGRARRRDHRVGHGQGRPEVEAVDHRAVPVGQAHDRGARAAARAGRRVARGARRARAQPQGHRRRVPARVLRRGHRRERQRQEHARRRHPAPGADAEDLPVARGARAGTRRSRAPSTSTRSSTSTSRRSGARRARTRPPTPACSTRSARCSRARRKRRSAATCPVASRST